jgi:glycosyltransferase involved in cell wall biosynthesis
MRIAFITPEFVTDFSDGGGLGNYLNRMGKLLVQRGHEVEIFVASNLEPRVLDHEGIRVERVPPWGNRLWTKIAGRVISQSQLKHPFSLYRQSLALADAMERRHQQSPFHVIQSADYLAVGLQVGRIKGRVHLIRCSSATDLYNKIDGRTDAAAQWREKLEIASLRRADKAYAPSRFVAGHYQKKYGIPVQVLRPPVALEVAPAVEPPCGLPERFLAHFGQLTRRKGTHWLIQSLKQAFAIEPSIRMVLIGQNYERDLGKWLAELGPHRSKLQVLYPLPKPELYALLQRADAVVLPSLVDNLPNTVIESLMLGLPVIGTRGASIDELVEHGATGELVSPGDVDGLAAAIVRVWRGQSSSRKGFEWHKGLAGELQPERAVENFLKLAAR